MLTPSKYNLSDFYSFQMRLAVELSSRCASCGAAKQLSPDHHLSDYNKNGQTFDIWRKNLDLADEVVPFWKRVGRNFEAVLAKYSKDQLGVLVPNLEVLCDWCHKKVSVRRWPCHLLGLHEWAKAGERAHRRHRGRVPWQEPRTPLFKTEGEIDRWMRAYSAEIKKWCNTSGGRIQHALEVVGPFWEDEYCREAFVKLVGKDESKGSFICGWCGRPRLWQNIVRDERRGRHEFRHAAYCRLPYINYVSEIKE